MATALVEQTGAGELYLQGLLSAQLRLVLPVVLGAVLGLGGLAAILALVPAAGRLELGGIPVAWLLLGVLSWPAMVAAAAWHVRRVERVERTFTHVLTDPELPARR